jgi:hypothetical protein
MNVSDEGHPAERFEGAFVSWDAFALVGVRRCWAVTSAPTTTRRGHAGRHARARRLAFALRRATLGHRPDGPRERRAVGRHRRDARQLRLPGSRRNSGSRWRLSREERDDRRYRALYGFGRIAPGVTIEQASADLGRS